MEKNQQSQDKKFSTASGAGKPFSEKQVPQEGESMTGRKPNDPIEEEGEDLSDEEEIETENKNWK